MKKQGLVGQMVRTGVQQRAGLQVLRLRLANARGSAQDDNFITEVREGTTGRIVARVWAVAESSLASAHVSKARHGAPAPEDPMRACEPLRRDGVVDPEVGAHRAGARNAATEVEGEVAFYRKYTEGVLRRYLRLSMAGGPGRPATKVLGYQPRGT